MAALAVLALAGTATNGNAAPGPHQAVLPQAATRRAQPQLELIPTSANFGVKQGVIEPGATHVFVLVNHAGPDATFVSTEIDGQYSVSGGTCTVGLVLAAGQTCTLSVTFSPSGTSGLRPGTLRVRTDTQSLSASLFGEWDAEDGDPTITVDAPAAVRVDSTYTYTVTITNNGPGHTDISTFVTLDVQGQNPRHVRWPIGNTLAAGRSFPLELTVTAPTRPTTITATATVNDQADPNPNNNTATAITRVTRH
ncbi:choice-of-anchor D domain-containing protein [Streptomyces diastatochromogenes]|uniref:DUF11 domain-containing protein n=1 Tax=Streptomyces diastatochromogenes TaxID=42236 RepID=A0A233S565_STRDA|nr:choice-of-anchor D domain-containing protein [Streptomyces diastatochromogenes]MCZ0986816.1 choice-of-anchor D domain-containing protein [Streptomyces diastatochromogenes]OXY90840.1 hypothetical protein BEK98_33640 [Streptomyces diastatochromogenes]